MGHIAPGPDASGLHRWLAASWFGRRAHLYQLNCKPMLGGHSHLSRFPSIVEPLIKQVVESIDGQHLGSGVSAPSCTRRRSAFNQEGQAVSGRQSTAG